MKKYIVAVLFCAFACTMLFAAKPSDEVKRNAVYRAFSLTYESAEDCREAIENKEFKKAHQICKSTLSTYKSAMAQAKKLKMKVYPGEFSIDFTSDPLTFFQDVEENMLFALVMNGDFTLKEMLETAPEHVKEADGFVAVLLGKNERMGIAYATVAETFKDWKGCKEAIVDAGLPHDPETFCVPDFTWLED